MMLASMRSLQISDWEVFPIGCNSSVNFVGCWFGIVFKCLLYGVLNSIFFVFVVVGGGGWCWLVVGGGSFAIALCTNPPRLFLEMFPVENWRFARSGKEKEEEEESQCGN